MDSMYGKGDFKLRLLHETTKSDEEPPLPE